MSSIGSFRSTVEVQKKSIKKGPTGPDEEWSVVGEYKAKVSVLSLSARTRYNQLGVDITHNISFRDSTPSSFENTRFIWNGVILEPIGPLGVIGRFQTINAKEIGLYEE